MSLGVLMTSLGIVFIVMGMIGYIIHDQERKYYDWILSEYKKAFLPRPWQEMGPGYDIDTRTWIEPVGPTGPKGEV